MARTSQHDAGPGWTLKFYAYGTGKNHSAGVIYVNGLAWGENTLLEAEAEAARRAREKWGPGCIVVLRTDASIAVSYTHLTLPTILLV